MEWRRRIRMLGLVICLAGCSTPYRPPVVVYDSDNFPGINDMIRENAQRPLDVLLVHGMCTHDSKWAHRAIDGIAKNIDSRYVAPPPGAEQAARPDEIQIIAQTSQLAGSTVRMNALVWSPLTSAFKQQLADDSTGDYTDCSKPGNTEKTCKPRRSRFNGQLKDGLLNDCLADALIYQGHYEAMRLQMAQTLKKVLEPTADNQGKTLVLISESLGSKILFDALIYMVAQNDDARMHSLAAGALDQLGVVFMGANQLPMLQFADPGAPAKAFAASTTQGDSLAGLLQAWRQRPGPKFIDHLAIVAITDPNDLLSYRLLRSQYNSPDVAIANVLVSNQSTWLGLLEEPYGAHTTYLDNPDVNRLIMSGWNRKDATRGD
jgi:hypothetical protein